MGGPTSEVGRYLVNHGGDCDYGDIVDPAAIDAYKVSGKENTKKEIPRQRPSHF